MGLAWSGIVAFPPFFLFFSFSFSLFFPFLPFIRPRLPPYPPLLFSFFFFPSSYPATAASLSSPSFFFSFFSFPSSYPRRELSGPLLSRAPPFLPLAPVHEHAHAPSPSSPVRACLLTIVRVTASSPPRPRCCLAVLRPWRRIRGRRLRRASGRLRPSPRCQPLTRRRARAALPPSAPTSPPCSRARLPGPVPDLRARRLRPSSVLDARARRPCACPTSAPGARSPRRSSPTARACVPVRACPRAALWAPSWCGSADRPATVACIPVRARLRAALWVPSWCGLGSAGRPAGRPAANACIPVRACPRAALWVPSWCGLGLAGRPVNRRLALTPRRSFTLRGYSPPGRPAPHLYL